MRNFSCDACGQLLAFENTDCVRCGAKLGFVPAEMRLRTLELHPRDGAPADGTFTLFADAATRVAPCANVVHQACNWLVPAGSDEDFCPACRLNRTIPDLGLPENLGRWREIETAKRRLVYALLRFGLPVGRRDGAGPDAEGGLAFEFLADNPGAPAMTGHADGLITINIAEADPAEREKRRVEMGEPYRTLLGHMRHEIGHYYWDLLLRDAGDAAADRLDAARAVFGDERADYAEALRRNYEVGPPEGWQEEYVSSYAASHPWEDFAETWTHYLHIVDTLDTAASFGLDINPRGSADPALSTHIAFDPYRCERLERIIEAWLPLTYAVNSLNRSMGQPDLYPFVLTKTVIDKLGFIHDLLLRVRRPQAA